MGGVSREGHEWEAEVRGADAELELAQGLEEHGQLDGMRHTSATSTTTTPPPPSSPDATDEASPPPANDVDGGEPPSDTSPQRASPSLSTHVSRW